MDPSSSSCSSSCSSLSEDEDEELVNSWIKNDEEWKECNSKRKKFACAILLASSDQYADGELEDAADALSEWDLVSIDREEGFCICSQKITVRHYIKNNVTREVAVVGSDCIKKLDTRELHLIGEVKLKGSLKEEHQRRVCCHCCKYTVSKDDVSDLPFCNECIDDENTSVSRAYFVVMSKMCTRCDTKKALPRGNLTWCKNCCEHCSRCGVDDLTAELRSGRCRTCCLYLKEQAREKKRLAIREKQRLARENMLSQERERLALREKEQLALREKQVVILVPSPKKTSTQTTFRRMCASCKRYHAGKYDVCWTCRNGRDCT